MIYKIISSARGLLSTFDFIDYRVMYFSLSEKKNLSERTCNPMIIVLLIELLYESLSSHFFFLFLLF